jgi:hypothetical protein
MFVSYLVSRRQIEWHFVIVRGLASKFNGSEAEAFSALIEKMHDCFKQAFNASHPDNLPAMADRLAVLEGLQKFAPAVRSNESFRELVIGLISFERLLSETITRLNGSSPHMVDLDRLLPMPENQSNLRNGSILITNPALVPVDVFGERLEIGWDGEYVRCLQFTWSVGQLESEIASGCWTVENPSIAPVFAPN